MQNYCIIYFSPTGATKTISMKIYSFLKVKGETDIIDITKPQKRKFYENEVICGKHLFIAAPVYAHKIPAQIKSFIEICSLKFVKASVIITYGNANEGYALQQIIKLLGKKRVPVVSAAVMPVRHSYQDLLDAEFIAPETDDFLSNFIEKSVVQEKQKTFNPKVKRLTVACFVNQDFLSRVNVTAPSLGRQLCNNCKSCISVCPVAAIDGNLDVDKHKCIRCGACVKYCNKNARKLKIRLPIMRWYLEHKIPIPKENKAYY
ncbi:MAG: hypothetical protein A2Y17_05780 [Clostridiales bacterium GWF2_38_85]|nr:MAG: hypothetical protein A2Y17_05780 [Clostridiales bacterium GWF2_38_85]